MNIRINKHKIIPKLRIFFLKYIETQLMITLVSLPILIYWGLPISKMSFIGNLIFLPILILFLTISSIIFFTELLSIPNFIFIYFLEKITFIWQKIAGLGSNSWLIGFEKTNIIILGIIPIITFYIIKHKKLNIIRRIGLLSLFLFIFTLGIKVKNGFKKNIIIDIEKKLFIKKDPNGIKIKDRGMFARKQSIENFIEFNLRQKLIKNFGTTRIKQISTDRVGIRTFKAIITCAEIFTIKAVKIPIFKTKLSKYCWKLFFDMKRILLKKNIDFIHTKKD